MSILMIVLIVLTVIFAIILISGIVATNYEATVVAAVPLVFIGVLGWGFVGSATTVKSINDYISPKVYKTSSAVVLEYKDVRTILDDARSYNLVNDSTKYQLKTDFNMYGFQVGKNIVIKE